MRRWIALFLLLVVLLGGLLVGLRPSRSNFALVEGDWYAQLALPDGSILPLALHIFSDDEVGFRGTIDSSAQGLYGISVDSLAHQGRKFRFTIDRFDLSFEGGWDRGVSMISGLLKQGTIENPLTFTRQFVGRQKRPQEPTSPYPYTVEEVELWNEGAEVTLAGTLTLPLGEGPFPAVILITGAGPQDRDETLCGHKPFWVLADHLTRSGIAVLRMDDRGVGESTGDFSGALTDDFAADALVGVAYLKERPEIGRIGLIGHSEGGIAASIAALHSDDLSFLVLMATPGVVGEEVLYRQGVLIHVAEGWDRPSIEAQQELTQSLCQIAKREGDLAVAEREMIAFLDQFHPEGVCEGVIEMTQQMRSQLPFFNNLWFRRFLLLDPTSYLSQVELPILALQGGRDLQVDPEQNLKPIVAAFKHSASMAVELPGLNHLFQTCEVGTPSEYGQISETIAPVALQLISGWILKQCEE